MIFSTPYLIFALAASQLVAAARPIEAWPISSSSGKSDSLDTADKSASSDKSASFDKSAFDKANGTDFSSSDISSSDISSSDISSSDISIFSTRTSADPVSSSSVVSFSLSSSAILVSFDSDISTDSFSGNALSALTPIVSFATPTYSVMPEPSRSFDSSRKFLSQILESSFKLPLSSQPTSSAPLLKTSLHSTLSPLASLSPRPSASRSALSSASSASPVVYLSAAPSSAASSSTLANLKASGSTTPSISRLALTKASTVSRSPIPPRVPDSTSKAILSTDSIPISSNSSTEPYSTPAGHSSDRTVSFAPPIVSNSSPGSSSSNFSSSDPSLAVSPIGNEPSPTWRLPKSTSTAAWPTSTVSTKSSQSQISVQISKVVPPTLSKSTAPKLNATTELQSPQITLGVPVASASTSLLVSLPKATSKKQRPVYTTSPETDSKSPSPIPSGVKSEEPQPVSSVVSSSLVAPKSSEPAPEPYTTEGDRVPTSKTNWLPTFIETAQPASSETAQAKAAAPETSGLPRAITPAKTTKPIEAYFLVTIGLKEPLNYQFVVAHSILSAQIFTYLPQVLKFPFGGDAAFEDITVESIVPYLALNVSYIISVAEVWFPHAQITQLQHLLSNPNSDLYKNTDQTAAMLAQLIDVRVPLDISGGATSSSESTPDNNGSVGSSNALSPNSGLVVGIAAGASVGSLAYLSFMVFMIRMLKKRNVELKSTDSESLADSPLWLLGRSPASQNRPRLQISEPLNAQNSLGWS